MSTSSNNFLTIYLNYYSSYTRLVLHAVEPVGTNTFKYFATIILLVAHDSFRFPIFHRE